ncbi:SDR family oxidoreductase [Roseimarinus sediminis]|uniref:SDR family oxidoreductase n=1 Tax=Roseimarinus sediminis TaxID=1610899 RepID=UPI003D1FC0A2
MKVLQNKNILITGGASGIGKIMARMFLEKNSTVIIWDLSQQNIDETLRELSPLGDLTAYRVDVSSEDQVKESALKVKKEKGTVDVLVNNAGIVVGKYFHEHSTTDISRTLDINTLAPMLVCNAFLPDMMQQNAGHICNIASSAGIVANPRMAVYAASKWALIGWSDSLRIEMIKLKKKVAVTSILPYYINTGMFDGVQSRIPILDPEKAAAAIVRAIQKDKKLLTLPGYIYRLTRISQALLPISAFDWLIDKVFGIYSTMDHFTGRNKKINHNERHC